MPKSDGSLAAVVVSGGKQYRVAPGDTLLVDRIAAEPGTEVAFSRVLLLTDGDDLKLGAGGLEGVSVSARVIGHRQGPKIDVLRYKSKKRVRVHRGSRAQLTALQVLEFGDAKKERAGAKQEVAAEASSEASSKAETARETSKSSKQPAKKADRGS